MMQLVIIAMGVILSLVVIIFGIIKIIQVDDYEIDFEKNHKGHFVKRFETDSFDTNHID